MSSFRGGRLAGLALPVSSVWLLTDIAEAKGRQDLYARQAPQLLAALRQTALVQSVESSNRIEGVTVAPDRLVPLVSRLLTLLALYQHGLEVGRYISLERLVEESREDYYEVLRRSSEGWHEGKHDLLPWLNYFLAVLKRAYRELEERTGALRQPRGAKTALVEAAVTAFPAEFSLADVERASPGVSRDMVRRVLRRLQAGGQGEVHRVGAGSAVAEEGRTGKRVMSLERGH